ncbi:hypothetical protein Tco_0769724 [Tanacetum coccineum]|uniref:Uncharacterized protein n=1 Tax=Tanacetum coccineum TaxID=301880 RepID=A0ABQ4ZA63_9ASTR
MNPIATQQVSLDNALVAPENRVQIGKCNIRIDPTKTSKEPTYQVVLDALALTTSYPAFLITAEVPKIYKHQFWHTITKIKNSSSYKFKMDKKKCTIDVEVFSDILYICPRLPNQEFVVPPSSDLETVSFIKELRYTNDIDYVTKVYTDHMHQPWRTFSAVINRCLSGKTTDFMFQIDNRDSKKQEKMYYPRFTKAIIQHFISKDKSISMRNRLFMHIVQDDRMTNRKMLKSTAYKTYLAFATGAANPKKARKFKKPASLSKKKTLVSVEEPDEKPTKKPATRRHSASVQIRDTPGVSVSNKKATAKTERSKGIELLSEAALLEEAQLKKAIKKIKRETNNHQAGGSSEEAGLEPEVPDEQKGKSSDTSEGTGLIPGVPDVSKADSSKSEYKSWGDSDDDNDDDDDQKSDDEQNVSDNPRASNDEEETQEDEFVHTPKNYVPTDDENVDNEEYERINKEMYDDVNVKLKDAETADEGKGDEEMTDSKKVDVENENKTKVPLQSSSISSDYATKFLNFDNIPSADTKIISMMDIKVQHDDLSSQTSPLLTVLVLVIPGSLTALATTIPPHIPPFIPLPQQSTPIPTPTSTEATISTTSALDSSTLTTIHQRLSDLENEVKTLRNVDHSLAIRAAIKSEVPTIVKEYLGTSLDYTLHKVIQRHTAKLIKEHSVSANALYHALMESILEDENAMDKGVADRLKKRNPDDADRDEGPPTRPD